MRFLRTLAFLVLCLGVYAHDAREARATISNTANSATFLGNGATSVFNFNFVGDVAGDISVTYTDLSGNVVLVAPNLYTLTLNAPVPGQIWGVGGTVTYPLVGGPIASGTSLTITRTLPLLQLFSFTNQGNYSPVTTEQAMDSLAMMAQQVSNVTLHSLNVPLSDPIPTTLPSATLRKNLCLAFDSIGNPTATACVGPGGGGIVAGTNGQIQYNNAGAFGGFTMTGDCLIAVSTGAITCTKTGGAAFTASATVDATNATNITSGILPVARGGTNCTAASGTCLDNISGFSTTGLLQRTGAGAYSVVASTGSGNVVLATSPTLVTPTLGAALATSINGLGITASTGTLTIANAKTLVANNSLTLAGTDGTILTHQGTGTVVNRDSTDTLTNKSIDGSEINSGTVLAARLPTTTSLLDAAIGSAQGTVAFRGAAGWTGLAPGSNGQLLKTGGAAADVSWVTASGTGSVTSVGTTYPLCGGPITTAGSAAYCGPTSSGRFAYVSTTVVKFTPYNGDLIRINGAMFQIPSAGIVCGTSASTFLNGVAAQALAVSTFYYVYAFSNTGTVTCDFSTNTHATSATAGNIGTEIKTGDDTRTLIGAVFTDGAAHFTDADANRNVISWFNRQPKRVENAFTVTRTTASTTYAEVNTEIRCNFIIWADDVLRISSTGTFNNGTTSASIATAIGIDGTTLDTSATAFMGIVGVFPYSINEVRTGISEGATHFATVLGIVSAGTGSWSTGGLTGSAFPKLSGFING